MSYILVCSNCEELHQLYFYNKSYEDDDLNLFLLCENCLEKLNISEETVKCRIEDCQNEIINQSDSDLCYDHIYRDNLYQQIIRRYEIKYIEDPVK